MDEPQSAQNPPSTLLAWHYRSRYESLISFSNAAFYSGNLFTIPDRQRAMENQAEIRVTETDQGAANVGALLARSISFHFMDNAIYENRCNPSEAAYIAQLVRGLLRSDTKLSIGVVAFSEAQQTEIEGALSRLADEDGEFAARIEAEYVRDRGVLTLEDAVRRMTSLPARTFHFFDRGVVRPGAAADLLVFDPARVQGRAR